VRATARGVGSRELGGVRGVQSRVRPETRTVRVDFPNIESLLKRNDFTRIERPADPCRSLQAISCRGLYPDGKIPSTPEIRGPEESLGTGPGAKRIGSDYPGDDETALLVAVTRKTTKALRERRRS
jgi:hypothetical protein